MSKCNNIGRVAGLVGGWIGLKVIWLVSDILAVSKNIASVLVDVIDETL